MTAFMTNPRKQLTDQQKTKLFLERGGRCHRCFRKLRTSDVWIVEHVQALQNGGTNEWANLAVTCAWCFPEKNREDAGIASKARHVATKHIVPTRERRKDRPMPGSRASGWKKTFSNGWVRREASR